jgi:hypothetical protein
VNVHDWRRGRTWLEQREHDRKVEERMHTIGLLAGAFIGVVTMFVTIGVAIGAL